MPHNISSIRHHRQFRCSPCVSLRQGVVATEWTADAEWAFWLLAICGVSNVISAIALLRWKRWGFWLFVVSTIAALAINFSIGLGPQGIFAAVLGIAILYAVLHIGGERKAWPRLQ
jgi:hypothetical protein